MLFLPGLQRVGLPFQEVVARARLLLGAGRARLVLDPVTRLGQLEVELRLPFDLLGAEKVRQVVVEQVFAARGRAVERLRQVLALGVERRTQTGRRRFVPVQEVVVTEVMEVSVARQTGTFFAVGAAVTRALVVTPAGDRRRIPSP